MSALSRQWDVAAKGFTLVELLVAVGILAVLAIGCYAALQQFVVSDAQLQGRLKALAALQRGVGVVQRDVSQMVWRSARQFQDIKPALQGDGSAVEFTRAGYLVPSFLEQPASELARVRYTLNTDGDLERAIWRIVDRPVDEPDGVAVVLTGVESLDWAYLPADSGSGEWVDQWPPINQSRTNQSRGANDGNDGAAVGFSDLLPWGVRLTLETTLWGELTWQWELPNFGGPLPSGNVSNDEASSEGGSNDGGPATALPRELNQ